MAKRPGRGVNHRPQSSAEVEERVEIDICYPSGLSWPVLGRNLPLPFTLFYEVQEHSVCSKSLSSLSIAVLL
jgi:hypothetical protein